LIDHVVSLLEQLKIQNKEVGVFFMILCFLEGLGKSAKTSVELAILETDLTSRLPENKLGMVVMNQDIFGLLQRGREEM
jgi:hypothetical protein